ncbi:MAG: hypothetical protein NZ700_15395 [Gemmataceae bacterium]|nr:hypothetical protein [Gemmataceae bacterium]MDW8265883.1 hypothetical protein [Gemmataceae bacterium]
MKINRELLHAYLDDLLSETETARIERELRSSPALREQLRKLIGERERGDHSLGSIWRRHRLSCPTREQLGSYLLGALDEGWQDYVQFHLQTVACPYCLANLADLQTLQREAQPRVQARRRRFFESSAGYLKTIISTPK